MEDSDRTLLQLLGIIIISICIFELLLIGIGFIYADKVKCNLFWCEFTITRGKQVIKQDCFMNGVRINCTEFNNDFKHFCNNDGLCEINGVMSIEEYYEEMYGDD